MRIVAIIARLLLGALMVFAGANHIFNFLPKGPIPSGVAGQLLEGMIGSGSLAMPKALPVAAFVTILWILAAFPVRAAFLPLLRQRVAD